MDIQPKANSTKIKDAKSQGVSRKFDFLETLKYVLRRHLGLAGIIAAALLLEITSSLMNYVNHNIIQDTMERLVEQEMNSIAFRIHNQLSKVEVTLDNMAWVVTDDLAKSDSMFVITRRMVENNPAILGGTISFIPNYYPEKGYWFEPFAGRRADGTIESIQLGSASHDYTKSEFFTKPIALGKGHWSEPYMDADGAKTVVTTYGSPVRDYHGKIVGVVDADLSLGWFEQLMDKEKVYKNTERFLVTGSHHLIAGTEGHMLEHALKLLTVANNKAGYHKVTDEKDEKHHIFFHPVGGKTDWVLISVLDDSEVFGKLSKVRFLLYFVTGIGLLVLGFIVFRTSRNLDHLRKVKAEKNRIDSELHVASNIQMSMIPKRFPELPGIDLYASIKPAKEVGGDLYDFFLKDDKLYFCIGDVSGKGVPASLLMMVVTSQFRTVSRYLSQPDEIMKAINDHIAEGNDTHMFVTMFIGILDLKTGHLAYCCGAHNPPLLIGSTVEPLPVLRKLPVGAIKGTKYVMQETQIEQGSTLLLYTDGLTEAMDTKKKMFGVERMKETVLHLQAAGEVSSKAILDGLIEAVETFVAGAEQSDDLTMMAIKILE